jgi:replicative DNA helicase
MQTEGDRAITAEENVVIDETLEAIERELEQLRGNRPIFKGQKETKSQNGDITELLGLTSSANQDVDTPKFLKPSQIKSKKRDLSKVMKSGINGLDNRIIGFNPGELSIWSGGNGSGKSSILSQIAIEGANQDFKIAIFSGELTGDRVLDWLHLQAAGVKNVEGTKYENYYTVPERIKAKINKWMDDKIYIYNNDFGTKVIRVLKAIKECIETHHINMVIIDNMMSLDMAAVGGEKYEKQTRLVLALCELAKQCNVHIHFVAHPRKSMGFLRKYDISGTADITNAADNVFIVHRVNKDFTRTIIQDMGLSKTDPLFNYSNIIEICKNRDLGISDIFTGLHFQKECKRFLNEKSEIKNYGWEKDKNGFVQVVVDEDTPFK